jgi:hypothetical protein
MKKVSIARNAAAHAGSLLNWVLCRDGQAVACRVDRLKRKYRVSVQGFGQKHRAVDAFFDAGLPAFQGHAAMVKQLRNVGWQVVAYR